MLDFDFAEVATKEAENLVLKTNKQIDDFLKTLDENQDFE